MKFLLLILFSLIFKLGFSQNTIKVRKELKIEGLYKNLQKKDNLPSYLYFTKDGLVYYTFSKKLKDKRALVKLPLCALDKTCNTYSKQQYDFKKGHIRFTTNSNLKRRYFIIYDGQVSKDMQSLSIRKEETNELIIVNKYILLEPKN